MNYLLLIILMIASISYGKIKSVAGYDLKMSKKVVAKTTSSASKDIALSTVSLKIIPKSNNNIGFTLKANISTKKLNTKMFQTSEPYYNRFSVQQNAKANSRFQKISLNTNEIIAKNKKYQNKIYIYLFK